MPILHLMCLFLLVPASYFCLFYYVYVLCICISGVHLSAVPPRYHLKCLYLDTFSFDRNTIGIFEIPGVSGHDDIIISSIAVVLGLQESPL